MGDPRFPIALVSEAGRNLWYNEASGRAKFAHAHGYVARLHEIVDADPDLLLVNMRRILEEDRNWRPRKHFGERHPFAISPMNTLAIAYQNQGSLDRADELVSEVLSIRRTELGR